MGIEFRHNNVTIWSYKRAGTNVLDCIPREGDIVCAHGEDPDDRSGMWIVECVIFDYYFVGSNTTRCEKCRVVVDITPLVEEEADKTEMRITSEHHIWKTVYDDDYFTRRVTSGDGPRWFGTNSGALVEDVLAEALEEAFQEARDE